MVIDSSALIAILQRDVGHEAFGRAIRTSEIRLLGSPTYVETSIVIFGRQGEVGIAILDAFLASTDIQIVSLEAHHAALALNAFRRFGKGRHPAGLNYGDCMSYALAKATGLPLLFKGDDFVHTDVASAV